MNPFSSDPTSWLYGILWLSIALLALPTLLASLYLLLLTALSGQPRARLRDEFDAMLRFDIIVPAHNEAGHIAATVRNLLAMDWPAHRFRVLVLADNCSDDTAARAHAAGARVIERHNRVHRGKGHALRHAFAISLAQGLADAVVVVDADSVVSPNLLRCFAERIGDGAVALQACHEVLDVQHSHRTRLMAIAFTAFHRVRSRGRERLGFSCGLRGNGWCVTHETLRAVPYQAYGLAEDIEYGLQLGLLGIRVQHVDEAAVRSVMATDAVGSASQRRRWEDGRAQLLRGFLGPLVSPLPRRSLPIRLDLALDLLIPPLSFFAAALALLAVVGLTATLVLPDAAAPRQLLVPGAMPALFGSTVAVVAGGAFLVHGLRGWQLSRTGREGLLELLRFPLHAAWKLMLRRRPPRDQTWIRTRRPAP